MIYQPMKIVITQWSIVAAGVNAVFAGVFAQLMGCCTLRDG